jgi:hypothetical protein
MVTIPPEIVRQNASKVNMDVETFIKLYQAKAIFSPDSEVVTYIFTCIPENKSVAKKESR